MDRKAVELALLEIRKEVIELTPDRFTAGNRGHLLIEIDALLAKLLGVKDRVFVIEEKHIKVAEKWIREHSCNPRGNRTAIGGKTSYTFVDTTIGQLQNVNCACGKSTCINGDDV